jgi:Spy/CpxP family protein refolding chaperone
MQLKDNKVIRKAAILVGVATLTGAIGVGLSAQMGPRASQDGQGPAGQGRGNMPGGPGMMRGGGPGGPGMMGGPGGPGGMLGMFGRGMRELNLTDAQREQMRTIAESHKADFDAIGERMRTAREALRDATMSGSADEATIRAKAAAVAAVDADAAVLQWKLHTEISAVLTPEQQQKAKELHESMKERMKNGPGRMMRRPGRPTPSADERGDWHDNNDDGGLQAV